MHNQLTKTDIKKMQDEIEERKVVVRHELLEHVKEARAQGDLSENFEYYAAKREKNKNESRIRYLERMIRTAEIVDDTSADDEVGINDSVTVFVEEDGVEETYRLVTTVRGDALSGRVSIESPIGVALLGRKCGDKVSIKVNDSFSYDVVIRNIDKNNDDSEDEINAF